MLDHEQTKTVKLIFRLFLEGFTPHAIAIELTRRGIKAKESYQRLLKSDVRNHLHLIAEEQAALLAA